MSCTSTRSNRSSVNWILFFQNDFRSLGQSDWLTRRSKAKDKSKDVSQVTQNRTNHEYSPYSFRIHFTKTAIRFGIKVRMSDYWTLNDQWSGEKKCKIPLKRYGAAPSDYYWPTHISTMCLDAQWVFDTFRTLCLSFTGVDIAKRLPTSLWMYVLGKKCGPEHHIYSTENYHHRFGRPRIWTFVCSTVRKYCISWKDRIIFPVMYCLLRGSEGPT